MLTLTRAVALLRLVIVALFGLLVVFETLSLPGQFLRAADRAGGVAVLDWFLTFVTVAWAISLQVALIMAWRLLNLVQVNRILTSAALPHMDALVRVSGAVVVTAAVTLVVIGLVADDPGGPMALLLLTLCVTVAHLVVWILRDILRHAIGDA